MTTERLTVILLIGLVALVLCLQTFERCYRSSKLSLNYTAQGASR